MALALVELVWLSVVVDEVELEAADVEVEIAEALDEHTTADGRSVTPEDLQRPWAKDTAVAWSWALQAPARQHAICGGLGQDSTSSGKGLRTHAIEVAGTLADTFDVDGAAAANGATRHGGRDAGFLWPGLG